MASHWSKTQGTTHPYTAVEVTQPADASDHWVFYHDFDRVPLSTEDPGNFFMLPNYPNYQSSSDVGG